MGLEVVSPIELAGLGIEAMKVTREVGNEQQPLRCDGHRGQATMDFIVRPNLSGLRDVACLGGVDARKDAHAFAVFGVLAHCGVNAVFPKHRRGVDFTRAFRIRIFEFLSLRRVAIVPPDLLEKGIIAFLDGSRIKRVAKTIATAQKNELAPVNDPG